MLGLSERENDGLKDGLALDEILGLKLGEMLVLGDSDEDMLDEILELMLGEREGEFEPASSSLPQLTKASV